MTPFANTVSIPVANKISPPAAKHSSSVAEQDENSLRAKKNIDTNLSLFDELIASLLTRQAPAQPQPVKQSGAVDVVAASDTASSLSATASASVGSGFSMEPALLVMPQDLSAPLSGIQTPTGDFTAELLSAMTPGLPATPVSTDATMTITVPVPVATNAAATDGLTVPAQSTDADPRLVACGFTPADMASLKEKFAGHPHAKTSENTTASATTPTSSPSANTAPVATVQTVETDNGIITVTFSPPANDKASAQAPAAPLANSAVALQVAEVSRAFTTQAQSATSSPAVTQSAAVDAGLSFDMMLHGMSEENAAPVLAEGETATTDTGFDPVEFRIAQSFSKSGFQNTSPQTPAGTTMPAAAANTPAATNAQSHGANANGVAHAAIKTSAAMPPATDQGMTVDTALLPAGLDSASLVATPAGIPQGVTSPLSSPVSQNVMASQSHPAIHATAAAIIKGAKTEGAQTLSLRLDPPELGRLQVEMKYKKGDPLKVHVVLEKADTVSMFQRDAHALENALKNAGLTTDGTSLSFSLAQDNNSFGQAMGGQTGDNGASAYSSGGTSEAASEQAVLASDLDVYTDSKTGITHYNLRV